MFCFLYASRPLVVLSVILVALSRTNNNGLRVSGFVPIQRHAATRSNGFPSVSTFSSDGTETFGVVPVTSRRGRCNRHQLNAIPPTVWWVLSHTTLPFFGIPVVINGTRKGGWYRKIDLPPWTPPERLFGPIWGTLYTCMGLAVSRISKLSSLPPTKNPLVLLWIAHFCLGMSWVPVFFGLQRFRLGLAISYMLIGSLGFIMPRFYAVDPTAAFLLVPYALWLSFATLGLNVSICRRNPTKNGYNEGMFQAQLIRLQENAAALVGLELH